MSRRQFGRRVAGALGAAATAPVLLPAVSAGVSVPQNPDSASKYKLSDEQVREVERKLAKIVVQYGSRLSQAQRERLRRVLAYNERLLAGIGAFPLDNGDPPVNVLRLVGESAHDRQANADSIKK